MSATEILGFITGAACVLLAVRENVWNWPIGIVNNIIFFVIFWQNRLYADSCLQLFFLSIAAYGWWKWIYGGQSHSQLTVSHTSRRQALVLLLATVSSGVVIYLVLSRFTNSDVPVGDAITTSMSMTAQYMMARKLIENWLLWIAANVIYIGLYSYKALYLTSALYAIFIVMCVMGYKSWTRTHARSAVA